MKKIASIILSTIALSSITLVSAAETKHTAPVHVETNTAHVETTATASKPTTTTAERDAAIKKAVAEGKLTKAQGDAIINTGMPSKSAPATPMALPANLHSEKRASSTAVDPAMMLGKDAKKIADTKKASTTIKKENVIAKKTLKNKTAPHVKADGTIKASN